MDTIAKIFEEAKKNPKMRKKLKIKAAFSFVLFIAFLGVILITTRNFCIGKTGEFPGNEPA